MLENVPNGSKIFIDSNIFIYHFLEALLDEVGVSSQTSISYIPFPKVAISPAKNGERCCFSYSAYGSISL